MSHGPPRECGNANLHDARSNVNDRTRQHGRAAGSTPARAETTTITRGATADRRRWLGCAVLTVLSARCLGLA